MTNSYVHYRNLYNNVKPIRGRSPEVRPIGNRRRDHEQIVRNDLGNGEYSYAAKLYNTQVVEYMPNGDVILRTDGWHTPSTAEFIHEHSPFSCWKQGKQLWVRMLGGTTNTTVYPIGKELRLRLNADRRYEPVEPIVLKKKITDRVKAKEARTKVKPFLDWTRTFLSMSDGWVMHETMKQTLGWKEDELWARYADHVRIPVSLYERVIDPGATEEDFMYVLCSATLNHAVIIEKRHAEALQMPIGGQLRGRAFYDLRVDFTSFKAMVYRWVRQYEEVSKVVEVRPGAKAINGVVTV